MHVINLGGRERTLALDLNAMLALLQQTGSEPMQLLQEFAAISASDAPQSAKTAKIMSHVRTLLWAMLVSDDPELEQNPQASITRVGSWIPIDKIEEVAGAILAVIGEYSATLAEKSREFPEQMAPFVPTPPEVVTAMIIAASDHFGDVRGMRFADLGAGDGRLIEAALNNGAFKVDGYELHRGRFLALADKFAGDTTRVALHQMDIRKADLILCDVVFMYLMPGANEELYGMLQRSLRPGAIVVSHDFTFSKWKPEAVKVIKATDGRLHKVFLFVR